MGDQSQAVAQEIQGSEGGGSGVDRLESERSSRIQRLGWDSDFFGIEIGRVEGAEHPDDADSVAFLGEVDREASERGFDCLYLTVDPADRLATILAQEVGYRLVEVAMDLINERSVVSYPSESDALVRLGTPDDLESIEPHLSLLAPWSRYAVDPRFGVDSAHRMYSAWIGRAAGTDPHHHLWVAEEKGEIVAFATGSTIPDELPRIDLIASSRSGTGRRIVEFAFDGFGDQPSMGGAIAARNVVSLRFVLGLGYRVSTSRYIFHRWLDD